MSIDVKQAYSLGRWDKDGISLSWIARCSEADTMEAVRTAFELAIPRQYLGADLYDISVEHETDTLYFGIADYKYPVTERDGQIREDTEDGRFVLEFDTGSDTMRLTQSIATASYVRQGETAEDVKGAIGWDGQRVNGIDIDVGVLMFSEQWTLPDSAVTPQYMATLMTLHGSVNASPFRGFGARSLLFKGAGGRRVSPDKFSVTFKFAASPPQNNIVVGGDGNGDGGITVAQKLGWQYMDVMYADTEGAADILQVPKQVNVHTVYRDGDFSLLGIGG